MGQMGPGGDYWSHVPRVVIWLMIAEALIFAIALWQIAGAGDTSPFTMWFFLGTAWLPAAILVYDSLRQPKYAIAFGITAAGIFVVYAILSVIILLVLFVQTA